MIQPKILISKQMKNLLIIAYYFPPSGGPGVQRVLKHVKYLREFGWKPHILTVSNGQFPARDESLLHEIPEDIPVVRTHIYEPYDLYRLLTGKKKGTAIDVNVIKKEGQKSSFKEKIAEFIRATFFIPDARIGWLFSANKAALQMINDYKIDALYSSSPPYTCSIIARNLKRKMKLPWIAGFRDPWTGFISSPKRWFLPSIIDKGMEKSVFSEADFVECAWLGIIKDALGKYPDLNKDKFIHVPNGFDSSDFPSVPLGTAIGNSGSKPINEEEIAENNKRKKKFTVTYSGSMYGRRNPASFFEALESLIIEEKINKEDLLLQFVGRFGNEVLDMFNSASFKDSIEIISYVPHSTSIGILMQSDALLLVVDESKESEEIVPGKVYEYIGVKKPIIAIAPHQSAIANLMEETRSGMVAHQSEIGKTKEIILKYYQSWKTGINDFNPDYELINSFERREAAKKLGELFDSVM